MALFIYLISINGLAYMLMALDKKAARSDWRRVPERFLFQVAFVGGSIGQLISMYQFRHKTRKASFKFGLPALLVLNIGLFYFLATFFYSA